MRGHLALLHAIKKRGVLTSFIDRQAVFQVSEQRDFVIFILALLDSLAVPRSFFRLGHQGNLQDDSVDYTKQLEMCSSLKSNRTLVLVLYPQ